MANLQSLTFEQAVEFLRLANRLHAHPEMESAAAAGLRNGAATYKKDALSHQQSSTGTESIATYGFASEAHVVWNDFLAVVLCHLSDPERTALAWAGLSALHGVVAELKLEA